MILHEFRAGTDKQIAWAVSLRDKFAELLLDANYNPDDILLIVEVRSLAVWWIDNRNRLNLKQAPNILKGVKAAVTRAGSIEQAVQDQITSLDNKILRAEIRRKEEEEAEAIYQEEIYLEEVFEDRVRPW